MEELQGFAQYFNTIDGTDSSYITRTRTCVPGDGLYSSPVAAARASRRRNLPAILHSGLRVLVLVGPEGPSVYAIQ